MSSLALDAPTVRKALADTLTAGYTVDGNVLVQVYRQPQGLKVSTCIIVGEMVLDFTQSMARGTDVYRFTVYACVPPDTIDGFDLLDALVSGNGAVDEGKWSVREIIWNHADLGFPGQISAAMLDWDGWGGMLNIAGTECVAARGHVLVTAQGVDKP